MFPFLCYDDYVVFDYDIAQDVFVNVVVGGDNVNGNDDVYIIVVVVDADVIVNVAAALLKYLSCSHFSGSVRTYLNSHIPEITHVLYTPIPPPWGSLEEVLPQSGMWGGARG